MATLNFPTSPALNDTYSFNGKTWVWNGYGWQLNTQGAINGLVIGNSTPAAGTFTTLIATGNISLVGNIVDTGPLWINTTANGNINLNPNGTGQTNIPVGILSVTANITGGNILTGGLISATGAVTGAVITGTSLTVSTGNITAGNLLLSGAILDSAQLDIQTSAANANIVLTPNGTGNVNLGRLSASGNITAAAFHGPLVGAATSAGTAGTVTTNAQPNITLVGTLSSLTVTANVTGGNILTAGLISATGNITGGNLIITGAIEDSAQLDIRTTAVNANIVLTPNGTGNVNIGGNIMPIANATANIGSAALSFNTVFAKSTSAQYADLAEYYTADAAYPPGTVVVFGGAEEITISNKSHDTRVAGVVSTQPAYIMNSLCDGLPVALTGRAPCRVQGPVAKGDVLVTAAEPGIAQKIGSEYQPGCVLGKSLEEITDASVAVIEVVVGRF